MNWNDVAPTLSRSLDHRLGRPEDDPSQFLTTPGPNISSTMSRRPLKPAEQQPIATAPPQQRPIEEKSPQERPDKTTETPIATMTSPTQRKRKSVKKTAGTSDIGGATTAEQTGSSPVTKRPRTNTPWTPQEEQRLKQMRDTGASWSEIAKTFPTRTEGSVKKHWYKDMHYAEFAEDESAALLAAIKEYDANKWKVIGQKLGKPAKACEQYAKEKFSGK
ncbi:hypothetical protein EX30DRAFT_49052 [Ascodesmis nigricans]|uniref:Myb-like domain-containing protein n=1 Tax=Ascodesmis nigricans TaxID=341454 RepID=A0A4V3SIM2_9PEZI|nr:hypothetical protein EX30DRAFT_49052 [Ascodesmis nigricans]